MMLPEVKRIFRKPEDELQLESLEELRCVSLALLEGDMTQKSDRVPFRYEFFCEGPFSPHPLGVIGTRLID